MKDRNNNRSDDQSIGSAVGGFIRAVVKQRSFLRQLSLVVATFLVASAALPAVVLAKTNLTSIEITNVSPEGCQLVGTEITVAGTATADAPPGNLEQYHVQIDWGDGSTDDQTEESSFGEGHGVATRNFSGAHTYGSAGTYTVTARIYHQQPPGNDGDAVAVDSIEVCVAPPPETWTISGFKFDDLNDNGVWDQPDEPGLEGWTINLDVGSDQSIDQSTTTDNDGYYEFTGLGNDSYTISEVQQDGWIQTFPEGSSYTITLDGQSAGDLNFGNYQIPEEPEGLTIIAHKIVCDNEADLPNWGEGGPDITADTAQSWINEHQGCHFVEGWDFQWGPQDAYDPGDTMTGPANEPWVTFGPTDSNGEASTALTAEDIGNNEYLWFREELKDGYIPFTFDSNGDTNVDNVSAEMYCHTDVLNYDNRDRIDGIQLLGATYYCVGFNVLVQSEEPQTYTISGYKFNDLNGNGVWDQPDEPGLEGWTIGLDGTGETQHHETTTTLQDGSYSFTDLTEGQYIVSETQQDGWTQTAPSEGSYPVTLPADSQDGNSTGNNFGNKQNERATAGGGGGFYTPPTPPSSNEEVGGEQQTGSGSEGTGTGTSNEEVGGEQSLPVTGLPAGPWVWLVVTLGLTVASLAYCWEPRRTR